MIAKKSLLLFLCLFQSISALSRLEQLQQNGYAEVYTSNSKENFKTLYSYFDDLVEFLQNNPALERKLFCAKERFLRTKDRNLYSSDFFGFYDESKKEGRRQIAFYYSMLFHQFININYPELAQTFELIRFFDACLELVKSSEYEFEETAAEFGIDIFSNERPPILIKVVKYLPNYTASKPHYDGTAFSLFLDSTDNQSLLFSSYKSEFTAADFSSPIRLSNSMLIIPGAMLTEFSIYPTPHIVIQSEKTRYAAIAFAMRPNFKAKFPAFSPLPSF